MTSLFLIAAALLAQTPPFSVFFIRGSHSDPFKRGQHGAILSVFITNATASASSQPIVVTEHVSSGLTIVSMSGDGWTCKVPTCTRSDSLARNATYPVISVAVDVAADAPAYLDNMPTVTGFGSLTYTGLDTGNIIDADAPSFLPSLTHSGVVFQGQTAAYSALIRTESTYGPTKGAVTVSDTLPQGLTLASMTGVGWTCGGTTCTRSDVLAPGASYPPITISVKVAPDAPSQVENKIRVSESGAQAREVDDYTKIDPLPMLAMNKTSLLMSAALNGTPRTTSTTLVNTAAGDAEFAIRTSIEAGLHWLSVTSTSNATPATLSIAANPSGLPAGVYQGSITATPPSYSAGAATVGVEFAIAAPQFSSDSVVNGASFDAAGAASAGALGSIFGIELSKTAAANAYTIPLPVTLGGSQVLINGLAAPLLYTSSGQINFQWPDAPLGAATVQVVAGGVPGSLARVNVAAASPGIFAADASGRGQGIVLNQDFSANSAANPARAGSVVMIYCTGLGAVNPPLAAGEAGSKTAPFNATVLTPSVKIGGENASVQFSAMAPGFVGLYQINAAVPSGASGNTVPVVITAGGRDSNVVTIAVRN